MLWLVAKTWFMWAEMPCLFMLRLWLLSWRYFSSASIRLFLCQFIKAWSWSRRYFTWSANSECFWAIRIYFCRRCSSLCNLRRRFSSIIACVKWERKAILGHHSWSNAITTTYLNLFLLQLQFLLKLARAVKPCCFVHILWRTQIVQLDVTETKVLTNKSLRSDSFGPIEQ